MHVTAELPLHGPFAQPAVVLPMVRALEDAGFRAVGVTDHPAPSRKWMDSGGHPTFDPFAALSYCAAMTSRIGLMTYLVVLPYRHPMLLRKLISTLSCLSNGRFTLVGGSGYLRSEFAAVGADFGRRGPLTDDALETLEVPFDRDVWVHGDGGRSWPVACEPAPTNTPDIWIGGSGRRARRRVVEHGAGWAPLLQDDVSARTTRSGQPLATVSDLAEAIDELHENLLGAGRDPDTVAVHVDGHHTIAAALDDPSGHDALRQELSRAGATHLMLRPGVDDVSESLGLIEAYGRRFVASAPTPRHPAFTCDDHRRPPTPSPSHNWPDR